MSRKNGLKRSSLVTAAVLALSRSSSTPLFRQIYEDLRRSILAGNLRSGTRLPSTRALAAELAVARNTVANAYEQLLAEGYVEGHLGSGTYVARVLPRDLLRVRAKTVPPAVTSVPRRSLSRRGGLLAGISVTAPRTHRDAGAFRTGLPALDAFPYELWSRLVARRWRRPPRDLVGYGGPAGYQPLRVAISEYLTGARGVRCDPDQVVIVAGSQQALDLAARILLDERDVVWVEDPGYLGARAAFIGAGARLVGVPVDGEGIDVTWATAHVPAPRLAYVSPSHQYPLGVTMSLARRLALLEWAAHADAWILEDDYDSEYRYTGRPLAALQGLDRDGRVIYLGTFSKVLLPTLRLGYMVVPADLVEAFLAARAVIDRHSPLVEQAALADFISEGHFARHIRRMRGLYAERQAALIEAASRDLIGRLDVRPSDAGMHLIGWLPEGVDDAWASRQAAAHGVEATALSTYCLTPLQPRGLVLGYTGVDTGQIRDGVRRLAEALG